MTLPPRRKKPRRSSRWRSEEHCEFVSKHPCCCCGAMWGVQVAHVRLGSHTGMSQKPDDWRTVSLCAPCHTKQHTGEATFWRAHFEQTGETVDDLILAFCRASPKAAEIRAVRAGREAA